MLIQEGLSCNRSYLSISVYYKGQPCNLTSPHPAKTQLFHNLDQFISQVSMCIDHRSLPGA